MATLLFCPPVHCALLISVFILIPTTPYRCDAVVVKVNLNMKGVSGYITFSQSSPINNTMITVLLSGLDQYPSETFPWHVHNYPFTTQEHDPCSAGSVGGHFDPFMASSRPNYSTICSSNHSLCEVGDLSGKFGPLHANALVNETYIDEYLPLYGVYSIVGRSIVIHRNNGSRWVCANIEYPSDVNVTYSPFRTDFAGGVNLVGDIFFIEPYSPLNLTTVFLQLSYISGSVNSNLHEWDMRSNTIGDDGNCADAGAYYNPRKIHFEYANYSLCKPSNQIACIVGDLTRKSSHLSFTDGHSKLLYTDLNLPVMSNGLNETIIGRSVVIHSANTNPARIACTNVLKYSPRIASVVFEEDNVTGKIVFDQSSPFSPTTVRIQLSGLLSRAGGYHVHEFPVDEAIQGSSKCTAAGGHYNPRNTVRNSSSPTTFDTYEIGDLSGKSTRDLSGVGSIDFAYADPYLSLFGVESIVGRSVVIHHPNDNRWLCANISYDADTVTIATDAVTITANVTNGTLQGRLVLTQLANDPYSETTIFADFSIGPPVMPSSTSSTHSTLDIGSGHMSKPSPSPSSETKSQKKRNVVRRQTQISDIYLSVEEDCEPGASGAYSTLPSCSPTNQLACSIQDLIGKHGPLSLGVTLLTDLKLPLTGPNSIAGMTIAVRIGDVNSSIADCISLPSMPPTVTTTTHTATPTVTTSKTTVAVTSSDTLVSTSSAGVTPSKTTVVVTSSDALVSASLAGVTPIVSFTSSSTVSPPPSSSSKSSASAIPSASVTSETKESESSNTATIVGIACGVLGGITLFFLMAVVIYYCVKRHRQTSRSADLAGRSSDTGKGYEPLQLGELAKKTKSTGKKTKRSEEYVEL